ncbi:MAG: DUF389 domain-containing protein [Kofleriaceae bacterium]|nr:DUF389 domain-containing protein [Kofleriaceae bacterium]
MLHRPRGDSAGYWLQLAIAVVLATLGLALNSTAVVIGAMLIAPLMRPIVELAMGLATGSTPLVLRTGVRSVASIVVVVAASTTLSRMLPFHEVTHELLARTTPSLLDLLVAAACALAGAYAVVISSSDVATTAAGTSIGISLVPPLCTAGYGISTSDWEMTRGAGLLFTANVTGIVIVASLLFVVLGFGQVDVRSEEATLDDDRQIGAATRVGRLLSRRQARLGPLSRVLLPGLLLGAIAVPLRGAVDEMSRHSDIRQRVSHILSAGEGRRIVEYSLDQSARPMTLRVVLVGDNAVALALEEELRRALAAAGARSAHVTVWAVPDAIAMSELSARLDDVPLVVPPPEPAPPPRSLTERVRAAWPQAAGPIMTIWTSEDPPRVRIVHLGSELGPAGRALLASTLASEEHLIVEERALGPVEATPDQLESWLPAALQLVADARRYRELWLCITVPADPGRRSKVAPLTTFAKATLEHAVEGLGQVQIAPGATWSARPALSECTTGAGSSAP